MLDVQPTRVGDGHVLSSLNAPLTSQRDMQAGSAKVSGSLNARCSANVPDTLADPALSRGYNSAVIRSFRGVTPRVHPTAFIDASAQVIGDVEIGEESSVWMCTVLRGDVHAIRVGRRTNVQDGAIVHVMNSMNATHATTIGDNVTIGHGAIVHGCTIEHQCLIGMGAILLNGAHVGPGSIVAAGTLLIENMRVPPRSLVMGTPGKVKRLLTQAETADVQAYADRYVQYRLHYL
jgi:carbonic anhydrase/acetyltransferase-like protein (isoleucine patch superfamily)